MGRPFASTDGPGRAEAGKMPEACAVASAFMQARNEAVPAKRMQKAAAATSVTAPVEY